MTVEEIVNKHRTWETDTDALRNDIEQLVAERDEVIAGFLAAKEMPEPDIVVLMKAAVYLGLHQDELVRNSVQALAGSIIHLEDALDEERERNEDLRHQLTKARAEPKVRLSQMEDLATRNRMLFTVNGIYFRMSALWKKVAKRYRRKTMDAKEVNALLRHRIEVLDAHIVSLEKMQRWIPVEERLPPMREIVLLRFRDTDGALSIRTTWREWMGTNKWWWMRSTNWFYALEIAPIDWQRLPDKD